MSKKVSLAVLGLAIVTFITSISSIDTDTVETIHAQERSHHVVQKDETLLEIATSNGYSVEFVAEYNQMDKEDTIQPKDKIYFPAKVSHVDSEKKEVSEKILAYKVDNNYGEGILDWQLAILMAVVQQESIGLTQESLVPDNAYDSALAVMSSITNRVDEGSHYGSDVYAVISAPNQYESFGASHFEKHLGNVVDEVKRAVNDGLDGYKNHNYLNFRSEYFANTYGYEGVNIGGNIYFND